MASIEKKTVEDETLAVETFNRLLPEFRQVPADKLLQVNLDIPSIVSTAIGSLEEVRALRAELSRLPDFDLVGFDKIEDYAMALGYAHTQFVFATAGGDDLEQLNAEGIALRERLLADVTALSHRGFVDGTKLKELKGTNGYKNLSTDLLGLAGMLNENWHHFDGKSWVEKADIERAMKLGQRLLRVVGKREQSPVRVAEVTELRQRAYTVLMQVWDEVRRAVIFLRWKEGDADEIAPSFYAGRGNGNHRRKADSEAPPADGQAPIAAPAPVPATPKTDTAVVATSPADGPYADS
jgi:hypothetical protein